MSSYVPMLPWNQRKLHYTLFTGAHPWTTQNNSPDSITQTTRGFMYACFCYQSALLLWYNTPIPTCYGNTTGIQLLFYLEDLNEQFKATNNKLTAAGC